MYIVALNAGLLEIQDHKFAANFGNLLWPPPLEMGKKIQRPMCFGGYKSL